MTARQEAIAANVVSLPDGHAARSLLPCHHSGGQQQTGAADRREAHGLPKATGRLERILADSGDLSENTVEGCATAGIEPRITAPKGGSIRLRGNALQGSQEAQDSARAVQKIATSTADPGGLKALLRCASSSRTGLRHGSSRRMGLRQLPIPRSNGGFRIDWHLVKK